MGETQQGAASARSVIAAMLISTFMVAVEGTVISTAMPSIVAQLGGFRYFSWAFGVYVLTQAIMTPLYGRLADGHGRRPVYLFAAVVFLIGSLLCGFAWNMTALIVFRAIQGVGGGGLVPLATIIIADVSAPEDRPRMMGYVSAIWGVSAVLGPLLGAFCVASLGWPFVFWVNLPIGVAAIAMVMRFLKEPRGETKPAPVDVPACLLLAVGSAGIMALLVEVESLGLVSGLALLLVSVLCLIGFVLRERAVPMPMLPVHLWRDRLIVVATSSALVCGAVLIGLGAFLPTWVQGVAGRPPLVAGLAVGLMTLSWTGGSLGLGRLTRFMTYRHVGLLAAVSLVIATVALLRIDGPGGWVWLGIGCVLSGLGLGLTSLVYTVAVQSSVARADRGRAISLFYFSRLIGQSLGAAAFGGVLNAGLSGPGMHDAARQLVDQVRRAALPPDAVAWMTAHLAVALHHVFGLGVLLAVVALGVAAMTPAKARLGG